MKTTRHVKLIGPAKKMLLKVRKFVNVEMISDGGSFALQFENCDGNQYILFAAIRLRDSGERKKDQHGSYQERELVGYDAPVLIDCDPAKRPQDTDKVFHSVLSGPNSPITWDQARQIIREVNILAPDLSPITADWLKQMAAVIECEGEQPPGAQIQSIWRA